MFARMRRKINNKSLIGRANWNPHHKQQAKADRESERQPRRDDKRAYSTYIIELRVPFFLIIKPESNANSARTSIWDGDLNHPLTPLDEVGVHDDDDGERELIWKVERKLAELEEWDDPREEGRQCWWRILAKIMKWLCLPPRLPSVCLCNFFIFMIFSDSDMAVRSHLMLWCGLRVGRKLRYEKKVFRFVAGCDTPFDSLSISRLPMDMCMDMLREKWW